MEIVACFHLAQGSQPRLLQSFRATWKLQITVPSMICATISRAASCQSLSVQVKSSTSRAVSASDGYPFVGFPDYTKPFTFDQDAARRSSSARVWQRSAVDITASSTRQSKAKFRSPV
eukprot:354002-Pyramimonas_sp.AAC.1